jgi:dihydropteroate synthase
MINDVSALEGEGMAEVAAREGIPVVLMHKKGEPLTMQENPSYGDVLSEITANLEGRIRFAVERGVDRRKILVDPGFGFGKRLEDNLAILQSLRGFQGLRAPLVVGVSRKSFLRRIFGEGADALLAGSVAAAALAASRGASLLRVHDVAATKAAIRLAVGA